MTNLTLPSSVHKTGAWAGRVALRVDLTGKPGAVLVVTRFPSKENWIPAVVVDSTYRPIHKGRPCGDGLEKGQRVYVAPEPGCVRLDASDGVDVGDNEEIWILGTMQDPAEVIARAS